MNVTDHIRQHILASRGVERPDYEKTEWSPMFEAAQRNRLVFGAYRYGPISVHTRYAYAEQGATCFSRYIETGNLEYLVDAANYALIEFVKGDQPNRHWAPTDDGEHCPEETR